MAGWPHLKGQSMEGHTAVPDVKAHCAADVCSALHGVGIKCRCMTVHELAHVREEGDKVIRVLEASQLLHKQGSNLIPSVLAGQGTLHTGR